MSSKDSKNAEKPGVSGTGQTRDRLSSGIPADRRKFCILASTYRKQMCQPWDNCLIETLGLVTEDGMLTNAGQQIIDMISAEPATTPDKFASEPTSHLRLYSVS